MEKEKKLLESEDTCLTHKKALRSSQKKGRDREDKTQYLKTEHSHRVK